VLSPKQNRECKRPVTSSPRPDPGGRAFPVAAVLTGLFASWLKALSERRLQAVAESLLPPTEEQKLEVGADPSGHPENMPPAVIVGRAASGLAHIELTDAQRIRAQRIIHYVFGAGLGVAYGSVASRWPAAARGAGTAAGLVIYAGTHGSVLPALGIQLPPWRLAPAAVAWEATSHAIFGAALEGGRHLTGAGR
jgi:putative membrane protein